MDIEIYCKEQGKGFPFIMLHGNGESSEYFKSQADYFSGDYMVITPDTRGHGKTPRGEGEFSLGRFANDLYDFMKKRGIEKAHILGFSDGANIAMLFALRHADMVEKLILNGGNIDPSGIKRSVQVPIEIGYRIARCFSKQNKRAVRNAEMLGLMVNEPHIDSSALGKIEVPTLVIAGKRDVVRRSHTELIANSLPNSKIVYLKGGHFIANENPTEFNFAVEEFLNNN